MEKAVTSFRSAILCNDRHYNAWYGLATIYFRQERFELSEYHFRRAILINPSSSVLHCYLGQGALLLTDLSSHYFWVIQR
jgi:anaphase-promoting complex subunit 3